VGKLGLAYLPYCAYITFLFPKCVTTVLKRTFDQLTVCWMWLAIAYLSQKFFHTLITLMSSSKK
jgi:hypothetical protein